MNKCFVSDAVNSIYQLTRAGGASPYFFVVGAGISLPSVPVADDIIQELRTSWLSRNPPPENEPPAKAKTIDRYEYWFRAVHPDRIRRQMYLRSKMQGQLVPSACYRLASILAHGQISRLVVTTNFDRFIARALDLLGHDPQVCDASCTANDRVLLQSRDIQVLHVHGTYQYYDCANLRAEIRGKVHPMLQVVDRILGELSPLVIGYSGWEDDVIMSSLRRRLYVDWKSSEPEDPRPLPFLAYWFCYREADLETLPEWLTKHNDVVFVVPQPAACKNEASTAHSLVPLRESQAISQPGDARLPADDVLQKLIQTVGVPATELDTDPIGFFVRRLKIYIRRLEDSQVETIEKELKGLMKVQEKLRDIQSDLDSKRFPSVLIKAIDIQQSQLSLSVSSCEELMHAAWSAVFGIFTESEEHDSIPDGLQLVVDLAGELRARGGENCQVREELARARVYQGLLKLSGDDFAAAVEIFDDVIRKFHGSPSLTLQDATSSAMVNKGIALCRWHSPRQADLPVVQEILQLYDDVIRTHGDSTEPALRESVASALVNRGFLLNCIGRQEESLKAYDEVIRQFDGAVEVSIQRHVLRAMINKAFRVGLAHVPEETSKAIELYEQATRRLAGSSQTWSRTPAALAWNGLAFQRLLLAKHTLPADPARAREILLQARDAIAPALVLASDSGMVIGNEAYIEFLLGERKDYARQRLNEAIRIGGEECVAGETADTNIYPVPEDAEFLSWIQAAGEIRAHA